MYIFFVFTYSRFVNRFCCFAVMIHVIDKGFFFEAFLFKQKAEEESFI